MMPRDAINSSEVSIPEAKFRGPWETQSGEAGLIWRNRKDPERNRCLSSCLKV